jgi:hypothetical protein
MPARDIKVQRHACVPTFAEISSRGISILQGFLVLYRCIDLSVLRFIRGELKLTSIRIAMISALILITLNPQ